MLCLSGASDLHLLTDGKSIYLEDHQERVIDLLKNSRQPMFLVCVNFRRSVSKLRELFAPAEESPLVRVSLVTAPAVSPGR